MAAKVKFDLYSFYKPNEYIDFRQLLQPFCISYRNDFSYFTSTSQFDDSYQVST